MPKFQAICATAAKHDEWGCQGRGSQEMRKVTNAQATTLLAFVGKTLVKNYPKGKPKFCVGCREHLEEVRPDLFKEDTTQTEHNYPQQNVVEGTSLPTCWPPALAAAWLSLPSKAVTYLPMGVLDWSIPLNTHLWQILTSHTECDRMKWYFALILFQTNIPVGCPTYNPFQCKKHVTVFSLTSKLRLMDSHIAWPSAHLKNDNFFILKIIFSLA